MRLFNNIDKKFEKIGFVKCVESGYGVSYERKHVNPKYIQRLDIMHKNSGRHLIQSYDLNLGDEKGIGNTCVGITAYEAKLCIKKMKQMGWNVKNKLGGCRI